MPRNWEQKYGQYTEVDDLASILFNRLNDTKGEIKVQLPCKVVEVNNGGNEVSVQILDYTSDQEGNLVEYPIIPNVPIRQPMDSGKAYIRLPIQKGDTGTIEFFDSDVSDVVATGVYSYTEEEDWHSLNYGLFTNGFLPDNKLFSFDVNSKIIIGTKSKQFIFKVNENDELVVKAPKAVMEIPQIEVNATKTKVTSDIEIEGDITHNGNITQTGNLTQTGNIVSSGTVTAVDCISSGKSGASHTHKDAEGRNTTSPQ